MTRYRFLLIGLALFLSSCGETAKRSAPEPEPEPEKALTRITRYEILGEGLEIPWLPYVTESVPSPNEATLIGADRVEIVSDTDTEKTFQ